MVRRRSPSRPLPGEALLTFSIDRTEVTAAARVVVQIPGGHSHSYTDTVTAPTCTEQGYTTHTCACGESYVDSWVDALGPKKLTQKTTPSVRRALLL